MYCVVGADTYAFRTAPFFSFSSDIGRCVMYVRILSNTCSGVKKTVEMIIYRKIVYFWDRGE